MLFSLSMYNTLPLKRNDFFFGAQIHVEPCPCAVRALQKTKCSAENQAVFFSHWFSFSCSVLEKCAVFREKYHSGRERTDRARRRAFAFFFPTFSHWFSFSSTDRVDFRGPYSIGILSVREKETSTNEQLLPEVFVVLVLRFHGPSST